MELSELRDKLKSLKKANILESQLMELPDGTQVRLHSLTQSAESSVTRFSLEFDGQEYMDAVKRMTLGHAICEVHMPSGEILDLREVDKIPTGEKHGDVDVHVEKHVFVREELILNWPEEVNDAMYRKYLELKYKITNEIEKRIKLETGPQMRAARISSLAETLKDLVQDCVDEDQLDIPMVYDFTPEKLKNPPQEPEQSTDEASSEPEQPVDETSEPTPQSESPQPESPQPQPPPAYDNLPDAEKQLLQEEQEEGVLPVHPNLKRDD